MSKTLIIAEAGVNHNGSLDLAKRLVDEAAAAGVDIIKFQTFKAEKLVSKSARLAEYQQQNLGHAGGSQYAMLKRLELSREQHEELLAYCRLKQIRFFSTAFDLDSVDYLHTLGLGLWKIPSGEITNYPYLKKIAGYGEPVILSTGMCELPEIEAALRVLEDNGLGKEQVTVLHCNTEYPTPMRDVNLRAMLEIGQALGVKVGYSDHTEGIEVPIAAVAAVVAVRVVPPDAGFSGRGFDIRGAALLFVALVCGLYVLESSPSHGLDTVSAVCTALFLVCISLFVVTERRAADPVIKLRLFRSRGLLSAMFLLTIVNMCYLGCLYLLPYYMSTVMGLDSLGTGLYLAIPAVATLLLCVWVGRAADRIGNRPFTIAASALMVASMVAYVFADADHMMPLIAGLVLMGVMWGLGGGTISNRMLDNMPDEDRPAGASMSSFLIYLGCAAGTAMFAGLFGFGSGSSGTAIGDFDAATFLDGFALACIAGAVLSAIGLILSVSRDERRGECE